MLQPSALRLPLLRRRQRVSAHTQQSLVTTASLHYEEQMQLRIAPSALDLEWRIWLLKGKTKYQFYPKTTASVELYHRAVYQNPPARYWDMTQTLCVIINIIIAHQHKASRHWLIELNFCFFTFQSFYAVLVSSVSSYATCLHIFYTAAMQFKSAQPRVACWIMFCVWCRFKQVVDPKCLSSDVVPAVCLQLIIFQLSSVWLSVHWNVSICL